MFNERSEIAGKLNKYKHRPGSLCGLLLHNSLTVLFADSLYPCFWDFSFTVLVDFVRVKSCVNCQLTSLPEGG